MKIGLAVGTPIVDQLWIGCVVANVEGNVLAVQLGADPSDETAWRVYQREQVMLSRDLAYVVHDESERARIVASWQRPCGRVDTCECETAERPRLTHAPAQPRPPMHGASPRLVADA